MTKNNDACAYGMVNREMITEVRKDIGDIKINLDKIDTKITDLFNHQSNRLPMWTTTMISLLCTLVGALAVWIITH